jgi:hypothetical protein
MALPKMRHTYIEQTHVRGAIGKVWASFLLHTSGETLILQTEHLTCGTPATHLRRTLRLPNHPREVGLRGCLSKDGGEVLG